MVDNDRSNTLLHYKTDLTYLGDFVSSDPVLRPLGGEISAVVPEAGMAGLVLPVAGILARRQRRG
jgi:hypothetical protein